MNKKTLYVFIGDLDAYPCLECKEPTARHFIKKCLNCKNYIAICPQCCDIKYKGLLPTEHSFQCSKYMTHIIRGIADLESIDLHILANIKLIRENSLGGDAIRVPFVFPKFIPKFLNDYYNFLWPNVVIAGNMSGVVRNASEVEVIIIIKPYEHWIKFINE